MMFNIFISSVQKEFATERKTIAEYVRSDALLSKHFEVFQFEELPPTCRSSACEVYFGTWLIWGC